MRRCGRLATSLGRLDGVRPAAVLVPRCCSVRAYSFARDFGEVLRSTTQQQQQQQQPRTAAPSDRAGSQARHNVAAVGQTLLGDLDRMLQRRDVPLKTVLSQYARLQAEALIVTLPPPTARRLLSRLLAERRYDAVVAMLLEYGLHEATSLVCEVLTTGFRPREQREAILRLVTALRTGSLKGMSNQILTGLGVDHSRRAALEQLIALHGSIETASRQELQYLESMARKAAAVWHAEEDSAGDPGLDRFTVLLLVDRALDLGELSVARCLVDENRYANEAFARMLQKLDPEEALALFRRMLDEAGDKPFRASMTSWQRVISAAPDVATLEALAPHAQDDTRVAHMLCYRALSFGERGLSLSHTLASLLDTRQAVDLTRQWFAMYRCRSSTDPYAAHYTALSAVMERGGADEFLELFSRQRGRATEARRSCADLLAVLRAAEHCASERSEAVERQISRHFLHASVDETLAYFALHKTAPRAIHAILNHHLRNLRLKNAREPGVQLDLLLSPAEQAELKAGQLLRSTDDPCSQDDFFLAALDRLRQTRPADVALATDLLLGSLVRLQPPTLAARVLQDMYARGETVSPARAADMVRHLLRTRHHNLAQLLLESGSCDYDTFARYISRTARTDPKRALKGLATMEAQGIVPRYYLLQNLATTFADGVSSDTPAAPPAAEAGTELEFPQDRREMAASSRQTFERVLAVLRTASKHGVPIDRIMAAALLRVTVVKQGLKAPYQQVERALAATRGLAQHAQVLEAMRNWLDDDEHAKRGGEAPGRLVELTNRMAKRTPLKVRRERALAAAVRSTEVAAAKRRTMERSARAASMRRKDAEPHTEVQRHAEHSEQRQHERHGQHEQHDQGGEERRAAATG